MNGIYISRKCSSFAVELYYSKCLLSTKRPQVAVVKIFPKYSVILKSKAISFFSRTALPHRTTCTYIVKDSSGAESQLEEIHKYVLKSLFTQEFDRSEAHA